MSIGLAKIWVSSAAALVLALGVGLAAHAAEPAGGGVELVRNNCSGCHREHAGQFERITSIRKTPEGWLMTIFRMRQVHGLVLEAGVRDALVRYLADTQGLAPSEAAAGRFALERRPNSQDLDAGADIGGMCSRCHSLARVALQRREEWRKLAKTHVGQWPSAEYSASGRDRPWFQIATTTLPPKLAERYPYSSTAWTEWQRHKPADLRGEWVVVGHVPGGKDFYGTAKIEHSGADYAATYELVSVDGVPITGDSKAIVYTGYEWRGSAALAGRSRREVFAVSEDGNRISGRWFDSDHPEDGGDWVAARADGPAQVLAVLPQAVRVGTTAAVTVVGTGLAKTGPVSFGDGVVATAVVRGATSIRAQVHVAADAAPGLRSVATGGADGKLAVYRQIDQLDVAPAYGIARVGGGQVAPVTAQFEALASTRLPGGALLALGPVQASWRTAPFDDEAKRTEDEKFAGHFDQRGCFVPAGAGPNPAREYSGDNVGNLKVIAVADDGGHPVEGHSHLIVTVQRWNDPPIY